MAKYTVEYLLAHDIDWFCKINGRPIHAASNGGTLPSIVNNDEVNVANQTKTYSLEYKYNLEDIEINTKYINKLFKSSDNDYSDFELQKMKNNYLRTFVDMARRGFYSFDRQHYDKFKSNVYIPIAWPKRYDERCLIEIIDFDFEFDNLDFSSLCTPKSYNFGKLRKNRTII